MIHKTDLWYALSTGVTLASIVVKLTPSKKDDRWVMKAMKALNVARR